MKTINIRFLVLFLYSMAFAEEAEIGERKNRISMNFSPINPWVGMNAEKPTELRYERLIPYNAALTGLATFDITEMSKNGALRYSLGIGVRKYYWGRFQRFSIGPLLIYKSISNDEYKDETYFAPLITGYTWQWNYLSIGAETGFGPGTYRSGREKRLGFGGHFGLYLGAVF